MSKTVSEILFAAADLIEPEGAWTTQVFARTASGLQTSTHEADAACWCVVGAMWRVANYGSDDAEALFASMLPGENIAVWNDAPDRTQAEVVAKLREAAEKAREQGL